MTKCDVTSFSKCVYGTVTMCVRGRTYGLWFWCRPLIIDEGQTEGWLASGLFSLLPCCSLTLFYLSVSGSLTSCCSSNIHTNCVNIGSHITSLPWYLFRLYSSCSNLPFSLPLLLSQWSELTKNGRSPSQRMNWKVRMQCLFWHLNIFTPSFIGICVVLAHRVPLPPLVVCLGLMALCIFILYLTTRCSNCIAEAMSICSIFRSEKNEHSLVVCW